MGVRAAWSYLSHSQRHASPRSLDSPWVPPQRSYHAQAPGNELLFSATRLKISIVNLYCKIKYSGHRPRAAKLADARDLKIRFG